MLIYLPCVSALITYYIFTSRGIDYRAVALGSILPIAIDSLIGHASLGHSFFLPVAALVIVMLATIGRTRMVRRRLLCVVIGIFMALVLEGTFLHESMWWWPSNIGHTPETISLFPSLGVWIIRDLLGVIALYVLIAIGELYKKDRMREFLSTGRITSD